MMINGVDLLFVLIGFILLLLIWEGWDRYMDWFEWNKDRRRQRKLWRLELQDMATEVQYRIYLRNLLSNNLLSSIHKATRSFEKFVEALGGNQVHQKKH